MSNETTYYQDDTVLITNTRAVLSGKTYSMANVTSVSIVKIPASRKVGAVVLLAGGSCNSCILVSVLGDPTGASELFVGLGIFFVIATLVMLVGGYLISTAKPTYVVRIGSASGETQGLLSKDEAYIRKIVNEMNNAIIARG